MTPDNKNLGYALEALCNIPRGDGRGRVITCMSPETGAGTSYVTRQLALRAKDKGLRVLLCDMDFSNNSQYVWFTTQTAQSIHGTLSGPYDARFNAAPFWQITPQDMAAIGTGVHCVIYRVGGHVLDVTYFDWSQIIPGQNVLVVPSRAYWKSVRDHYDLILIDTPAIDRSRAGLTAAQEADGCIVIAATGSENGASTTDIQTEIRQANGRCVGVILNAPTASKPFGVPSKAET